MLPPCGDRRTAVSHVQLKNWGQGFIPWAHPSPCKAALLRLLLLSFSKRRSPWDSAKKKKGFGAPALSAKTQEHLKTREKSHGYDLPSLSCFKAHCHRNGTKMGYGRPKCTLGGTAEGEGGNTRRSRIWARESPPSTPLVHPCYTPLQYSMRKLVDIFGIDVTAASGGGHTMSMNRSPISKNRANNDRALSLWLGDSSTCNTMGSCCGGGELGPANVSQSSKAPSCSIKNVLG